MQSPIHDWVDGSAMRFYYETAPIPTALAWYAHHLPAWWHHIESNATLVWEMGVPVLIFAPRRGRIVAAIVFTGFQLINIATANYGFFSYLALPPPPPRAARHPAWPARAGLLPGVHQQDRVRGLSQLMTVLHSRPAVNIHDTHGRIFRDISQLS